MNIGQELDLTKADRLPPHSIDAEQAVLGCCLIDPEPSLAVCQDLDPAEIFYDLRHRTIFEAIRGMVQERGFTDLVTLVSRLKDAGELEAVGGMSYLSALQDIVPIASLIGHYLTIVKEKSEHRRVLRACSAAVAAIHEPECNLGRVIEGLDSAITRSAVGTSGERRLMRPVADIARHVMDRWDRKIAGGMIGLPTGYPDLDRIIQGLEPGKMIVVAARPSQGKTALSINIASNIVRNNIPVGILSLEMTDSGLLERMMSAYARINSHRPQEWGEVQIDLAFKSAAWASKLPLYIDDQGGINVVQLRSKARKMKRQHGIQLLVIDYLQMLHNATDKGENREQEIAQVSNACKGLAKELDIPVIVVSQLNRETDKDKIRKPRLSDLRGSGSIEQDCDIALLIYAREQELSHNPDDPVKLHILVAKNRDGPVGEVPLLFVKQHQIFLTPEITHE